MQLGSYACGQRCGWAWALVQRSVREQAASAAAFMRCKRLRQQLGMVLQAAGAAAVGVGVLGVRAVGVACGQRCGWALRAASGRLGLGASAAACALAGG